MLCQMWKAKVRKILILLSIFEVRHTKNTTSVWMSHDFRTCVKVGVSDYLAVIPYTFHEHVSKSGDVYAHSLTNSYKNNISITNMHSKSKYKNKAYVYVNSSTNSPNRNICVHRPFFIVWYHPKKTAEFIWWQGDTLHSRSSKTHTKSFWDVKIMWDLFVCSKRKFSGWCLQYFG